MSPSGKMITWVVVAIVVIGGIWLWMKGGSSAPVPATTQTPSQTAADTSANQNAASAVLSTKDNSDASLAIDLSSVDGLLTALGKDSASVDKDLGDTPVPQN